MKDVKAAAPQFEIIGNLFKVTLFPTGAKGIRVSTLRIINE